MREEVKTNVRSSTLEQPKTNVSNGQRQQEGNGMGWEGCANTRGGGV
jgi:hypothetical protein